MKKITLNFLSYIVVFFLLLYPARLVLAHGDEPRLEISPERSNPGGVVDVRGFEFEREAVITLMLVNSNSSIALGEISADVEGAFLQIITLPVDLTEGAYKILATTYDHQVYSPELTILGPPIDSDAGAEGVREQEEPLLAPLPTFAPGVVPNDAISQSPPQSTNNARRLSVSLVVMILLGFGILAVFGVRSMRKRG